MPVSAATYERLALEDLDAKWELVCGRLRRKPEMTAKHYHEQRRLVRQLVLQTDADQYEVGADSGKLRTSTGSYYIPDVVVLPAQWVRDFMREKPTALEVYELPVPFVAEVWSPSTGEYDVDDKFPEYQRRGDEEIWRVHPIEHTVTAWRRQADGSYTETIFTGGEVQLWALAGVTIDLDWIFA